jgi:hypothetical protein
MTIHVATLTGLVDLLDPDPKKITPAAIAFGLAKLNRWAGDTELPLSVAQHSKRVGEIFRIHFRQFTAQAVHADLHDAHEYLIGDQITPLARLLDHHIPGAMSLIGREKARLDVRILEALDLPPPSPMLEVLAAVNVADQLAAHEEWLSLVPATNGPSPFREIATHHRFRAGRVTPAPWPEAERNFLAVLVTQIEAAKVFAA